MSRASVCACVFDVQVFNSTHAVFRWLRNEDVGPAHVGDEFWMDKTRRSAKCAGSARINVDIKPSKPSVKPSSRLSLLGSRGNKSNNLPRSLAAE
eukprot:1192641-Prorocentrum_minimum.AAC.3